jgi:hypothetical protein
MPSKHQLILDFMKGHPTITTTDLYAAFPKETKEMLRRIRNEFLHSVAQKQTPGNAPDPPDRPPASPPTPPKDITEDTYRDYLIRVINENDADIRICTEIRNYLDKKKALKTTEPPSILEKDFGVI